LAGILAERSSRRREGMREDQPIIRASPSNRLSARTPALMAILALAAVVLIYPLGGVLRPSDPPPIVVVTLAFRLALSYLVFQTLGFWFYTGITIFRTRPISGVAESERLSANAPKAAVVVPIRDEPTSVIQRMLSAVAKITYPEFEVVIVDNSTSSLELDSELHDQPGISLRVLRKPDTVGFKAGAVNLALRSLPADVEYVLLLDVDQAPTPDVLNILVPHLEHDAGLAFVQAPQRYVENGHASVGRAFDLQQAVFYDLVCPGLSTGGVLFMCGSNVLIRKAALDTVGGLDETSLAEDLRTSLQLHRAGWKGIYCTETVALGYPPRDLPAYHTQQRRWAIGTFQNYLAAWRLFFRSPRTLSLEQWLVYLGWNGTWYFQGFANLALAWCLLVFLVAGFRPFDSRVDWAPVLLAFPTLLFQWLWYAVPRKLSITRVCRPNAIFFGNSILFVAAAIDAAIGRKVSFQVTRKDEGSASPVSRLFIGYHAFYVVSCAAAIALSVARRQPFIPVGPWVVLWLALAALCLRVSASHPAPLESAPSQ